MYTIDLNEEITQEQVRKLLASDDDDHHSQIRVSQDGHVYIQRVRYGEDYLEGVLFRSVTFDDEGGWVGPKAAEDLAWVREVYEDLKRLQKAWADLKVNWPKPTRLLYGAERP